jgi:PAS domain S-box-containing protein
VVTQQMQAEEALMLSERHLSAIFRESPVPLAVSHFESGRMVEVNRALLDLLRATSPGQILGRTSIELGLMSQEVRERLIAALSAGGRVDRFLAPMRRIDGAGFDAELSVNSYQEGGKRFLLTSVADITERKRAEIELADSRAHYRALFESANDAIFLTRIEPDGSAGKFVAVNNVAVERLGYSAAEFREMSPASIDAEWLAHERREAMKKLSTHGSATFEMVQIAKDGRAIPAEISARRFLLGSDPFILAIARDLTARKRDEEQIARLATAIEQALETVVITDADARIVYANPAFEKSSGYAVAEALGKNPRFLQGGKHPVEFYRQMWEVLGRGETWRGRLQNRRKDGTLYLEDASISPVRDESGRVVNYIALKLDVTHQAELQAELMQAQKMESIGRLAGGVAHDFNNLLTIIMGYSKLAMAGLKPGDVLRDQLEEIQKAGERAAGLTRQLLAFSRKQILQPRVLDLNHVVEDMRKMLERMMGEDVEVRFDLCADPPVVHADPHQLQQVIMNLAVNARDAMPNGGILTVMTGLADRNDCCAAVHFDGLPGYCAMLTVSDTGIGMDEATQQRIFEPFFTTKAPDRGTGLGLSIVQGVVAQSGGCIRLHSEPGRGSKFQVYLPLWADSGSTEEKGTAAAALTGNETILVVEDQDDVRTFTIEVLKAYGYRTLEAAGGDDALTLCREKNCHIDLVLSDVVMPGFSGRELATRLAEIRPALKVVTMSGYSNDVIPEGATNFISKPFSPEQLAAKVRAALGPARVAPHVLVADDEISVRTFLRTALESAGYRVTEAADGKEVMDHVRSQPVDLVISDLVMPGREGIETIQALRRELPEVPIIAMSGAFDGGFSPLVKMLGADGILGKPFSYETLLATVSEVLALRSRAHGR